MAYTLGQAAKATGKAKPTILNALRNGRISGFQDERGRWQIEPVELHRVYPHNPVSTNVHLNENEPQNSPSSNTDLSAAQAERDGLRALVLELRSERNDLRRRLDDATEQERRLSLLLADQRKKPSWLERIGVTALFNRGD